MNFNDYQDQANDLVIYPIESRLLYPALGLIGKADEVADKIKMRLFLDDLEEMYERGEKV